MLADKNFHYSYSQINNATPRDFCELALSNSMNLNIGLGYFSSASFNALACGFAKFISNGGVLNLYINKYVSIDDYNLLKGDYNENFDDELVDDFNSLKKIFDSRDEHFFRCISYLIEKQRVNVKIVVLSNGGIPHEKYGIFTDEDGNKIYFIGSMNMTANAILGNLETIECTCSWRGEDSKDKVLNFERHFQRIWNGDCEGVKIYSAKKFCTEIMTTYPDQDPEILLKKEQEFLRTLSTSIVIKNTNGPHFPLKYKNGALPYQEEAYNAWIKNNKNGIFAMATGTGKTVTSLNCVLHEYKKDGFYQLLILVPTLVLVEQWKNELNNFNYQKILSVSSLNPNWRRELLRISDRLKRERNINFVIISTYDSFINKDFQHLLPQISENLILIADEAHNIGGKQVKENFKKLTISRRIGLSATPERIYDDNSENIGAFFKDQRPYVYAFPMSKAINENRLCKYYYYPKVAFLNQDEMDLYAYYTNILISLWDSSEGKFKNQKLAEIILMNRKRIIHKCDDKLRVYKEILEEIGEDRLKYTFVYAPQGKYSKIESDEDKEFDVVSLKEEDDIKFIQKLLDITKQRFPNIKCNSFTSKNSKEERAVLLQAFEQGSLNMLLAMKCLDEGVDVPRAEVGIFTSSTCNPREFIQRRGRLLRMHPEKRYGYIYDVFVIPNTISREQSFSTMERNLVCSELQRVAYFSSLALNDRTSNGAYEVLSGIARHFGIIWNELFENVEQ